MFIKLKIIIRKLLRLFIRVILSFWYFFPNLFEFGLKIAFVQFVEYYKKSSYGYSDFFIRNTQEYMEKYLNPFIKSFDSKQNGFQNIKIKKRLVWVCWWQGLDSMPRIVDICFKRIAKTFDSKYFEVILITKDNYHNYLNIPDNLLQKYYKNKFSLAHLADILRWGLVSSYGGMWIDATVFLTSTDYSKYLSLFDLPYYTQRFSNETECPNEPCKGLWNNFFFIGNPSKTSFHKFIYEALLYYWQHHNRLIHYVIMDYILMTAYNSFDTYRNIIDAVPPNNKQLWNLLKILNNPFNQKEWNEMMANNDFYKLTYKIDWETEDALCNLTYYGFLVKEYNQ